MKQYTTFATWSEVLEHVRAKRKTYYMAPMDHSPARVMTRMDGRHDVRVYPLSGDADAFTADAGHLERFRKVR